MSAECHTFGPMSDGPANQETKPMTRPTVDPTDLVQHVRRLLLLTDDRAYAQALADSIMDPIAEEQAAFRSPELAQRSLVATRFLIDDVNAAIQRKADESTKSWRSRADHFRNRVGMERRLLEAIVDGLRAQRGILPAQPNPKARAMRRLWSENMAGDVPKGRYRELLELEQQADADRAARQKEERKQARRTAKAAAAAAAARLHGTS